MEIAEEKQGLLGEPHKRSSLQRGAICPGDPDTSTFPTPIGLAVPIMASPPQTPLTKTVISPGSNRLSLLSEQKPQTLGSPAHQVHKLTCHLLLLR